MRRMDWDTFDPRQVSDLQDVLRLLEEMASGDYEPSESIHMAADELLCEALRLLGREDIAEAFVRANREVGFWYS